MKKIGTVMLWESKVRWRGLARRSTWLLPSIFLTPAGFVVLEGSKQCLDNLHMLAWGGWCCVPAWSTRHHMGREDRWSSPGIELISELQVVEKYLISSWPTTSNSSDFNFIYLASFWVFREIVSSVHEDSKSVVVVVDSRWRFCFIRLILLIVALILLFLTAVSHLVTWFVWQAIMEVSSSSSWSRQFEWAASSAASTTYVSKTSTRFSILADSISYFSVQTI